MTTDNYFLFSVDLEDVRDMIPNGTSYREAVPENTLRYLNWLDKQDSKCTFFVVGITAEAYPDLIKEIIGKGHEIACHSYNHTQLTELDKDGFRRDLDKSIKALRKCGVGEIAGFRAPTFSLVPATDWAHGILKEFNFKYSSSVLPAKNPLHGWSNFKGEGYYDGIYEIPANIGFYPFKVPFGGGVYFRCIPMTVLKQLFRNASQSDIAVISYFHPYDIDTKQEDFFHPNISNNRFYNWLMYYNRSEVFKRLQYILQQGFKIITYREYFQLKTDDKSN